MRLNREVRIYWVSSIPSVMCKSKNTTSNFLS